MKLLVSLSAAAFAALAQQNPDFPGKVFPVLQKAGCAGCHNPDGVASGTRLHFPEQTNSAADLQQFGESLRFLVDKNDPAKSLLIAKPTKRVAHAGGRRIMPGTPDEQVLQAWVNYLATHEAATTEAAVSHTEKELPVRGPVLRRLTHTQYTNTLKDLLGDETNVASQFPAEDFVNGFKNQYSAQSVSPLLAEAYSSAAEKVARNAFRGGDTRKLIPCKPAGTGDAACADRFIRQFGAKAFRRPLTDPELDRYRKLFRTGATDGKSFVAGAQFVVEAMLQSPNFLLRTEGGTDPKLHQYEVASRLSYFLWNSMPDPALFRAAESGELNTPAGVEKTVRRLLQDPRAKAMVDNFLEQWLRFDRLLTAVKDRRTFPQYTPELAVSMTTETKRLVGDLVWNNRNFMDFYSADYGFLSSDLANLYGVPVPAKDFDKVILPSSTGRAGILGQAVFLALTSKPAETSPTARGLFVREQFLCQDVPQPPPGVSTNLPALNKDKPMTNRERLGVHLSSETCASCHTLIDPIGFGLEKFDAIGQKRETLKLTFTPAHGEKNAPTAKAELPLDTHGEVAGIKDSQFTSPRELGTILASSTQCQECVVKQLFRYAVGRKERPGDRPMIRRIYEEFRDSQFRFQDLIVSLVKWTEFPETRNADASGVD